MRAQQILIGAVVLAVASGCTSADRRDASERPEQRPAPAPSARAATEPDTPRPDAPGGSGAAAGANAPVLLAQAQPAGARGGAAGGRQGARPSLREQEQEVLAEHHYKVGRQLYEQMRYQEAAAELRLAVKANPNHTKARELLDRVLFILGERAPGFRDQLRRYTDEQKVRIQQARMEIERLYAEGRRYMERHEYDRAIDRFERVLETLRWFPYHVDTSGIEGQTREMLKRAKELEKERELALREQMQKAAKEEAAIWERRNRAYHEARVRTLFEQAQAAYDRLEFEKAERLCRRLLDLEPGHSRAKKLLERAINGRRHQAEVELVERQIEETQRLMEGIYAAAVPYQDIFRFPDDRAWKRVQQRAIDLQRRFEQQGQRESAEAARIRRVLETRKVSVNFPGVSFDDALTYLQQITGLNFVVAKGAREEIEANDPQIQLTLENVRLKNALKVILAKAGGLIYRIKYDTVWINTKDAEKDELYLRFYEVSEIVNNLPDNPAPPIALMPPSDQSGGGGGAAGGFTFGGDEEGAETGTGVGAEKLQELIESRLGDEGEGSVEFLGGLLMVRKPLADHKKVEKLLEQLRRTTGVMVTVETRFIDIQDNLLEEIGVDFRGLPAVITNFLGTGSNQSVGYNYTSPGFNTDLRGALVNVFSQALGSAASTPFNLSAIGGGLFQYNVLEDFQLQAIISAVKRKQRARQVDSPRLTVFNGQRSHALNISQRAYIADIDPNQSGVTPTINPVIGVLNLGSLIEARPVVSHDRKYVTLEIQPTLAQALPPRFFQLILSNRNTDITIELPSVSLSQIKTTVMVPDGGTVILGGLKNFLEQEFWAGIPGARNIPLLGNLLEKKGYTDFKRSLIVLMTVHITIAREEERRRFNDDETPELMR